MTDVGNDFIMPARRFHLDLHPQKPQNSVNRFTFSSGQSSSGVNMQVRPKRSAEANSIPDFSEPAIGCEPTKVPLSSVVASLASLQMLSLHTAHVRDQNILHGPWHYLSDHLPDTVHRGATHDQITTEKDLLQISIRKVTPWLCPATFQPFLFSSPHDDSFADFSLANRHRQRGAEKPRAQNRDLFENWH